MTSRAEQRESTRRALVHQARRLFTRRGYADVGLAELVAEAEVTKGALYHHFPEGKMALFTGVLAEVQSEVAAAVVTAAQAQDDEWEQLRAGCHAFLINSTRPAARRIMLVDAPAVLGWTAWRRLDDAASGRELAEQLERMISAGLLVDVPVEPLTRMLSGAMNEVALWLASAAGRGQRDAALQSLDRILDGLRRT